MHSQQNGGSLFLFSQKVSMDNGNFLVLHADCAMLYTNSAFEEIILGGCTIQVVFFFCLFNWIIGANQ